MSGNMLPFVISFFLFFSLVGLGSELRASHLKAGALLFEPHLQSILLWFFWTWGLRNYLSLLVSDFDPPYLSLSSGWNYRREPLDPSFTCNF
jgi:hypothetical protein